MLFVKLLSLTFATKLRVFSSVKLVWFCFWLYISLTCIYTFREGLGDQMFPKCWQSAFNCLVINDHFGEPCSALWTNPPLSGNGELFSRCTLPVSTFLSIEPLVVLCCVGAIMSVHCTLRRTKEALKRRDAVFSPFGDSPTCTDSLFDGRLATPPTPPTPSSKRV